VNNATPSPSFRSAPLAGLPVVQFRAAYGALVATSFARPGEAPSEWVVTRTASPAKPRVEKLDLAALRHGGFHSQCRALAAVIKAGLAGKL
jgi:hypothetical protein